MDFSVIAATSGILISYRDVRSFDGLTSEECAPPESPEL
jgi:hypothetical protein